MRPILATSSDAGAAGSLPYGRRLTVTGLVTSADSRPGPDGVWQRLVVKPEAGASAPIVAVGVFNRSLRVGERVRLTGFAEEHPEHGSQLRVVTCRDVTSPTTDEGTALYLAANVPGCGPARAQRIVAALGAGCLSTLRDAPHLVQPLFPPRVGAEVALGLTRWATEMAEEDEVPSVVAELMAAGLGPRLARRVVNFFRSAPAARAVLARHPYRLLAVPMLGWQRVDAVARRRGVAHDAPARLAAAIGAAMTAAVSQGHSALPRARLLRAAARVAGTTDLDALTVALEACVTSGDLLEVAGLYQAPAALDAEWRASQALVRLATLDRTLTPEQRGTCESVIGEGKLSDAQAHAVWTGLEHGAAVLTGGPGTGKTTTTRVYLDCCKALGWSVKIVAPSGKAASRASEVTKVHAETIHRLLGVAPGLRRDAPIEADVLVVDEVSMCSLETAAWLLDNIDLTRTRLLLVGDADQLPSVEHGAVLSDVIASGVIPVARLTEVHRQAATSRIVINAHALLHSRPLDLSAASDFAFLDVAAPAHVRDGTAWEHAEARARLMASLPAPGTETAAGVQVLTPMRRGPLGVDALNLLLQETLNPHGKVGPQIGGGAHVRVGDRVIQVRNDYTAGESGLFNGEQGIVEVADAGSGAILVRFGPTRRVVLSGVQLLNLRLAWAVTVHRSQGSEWPTVVLLYHDSHDRLLDTRLLYTALTRAKQRFVLIGTRSALETTARRRAEPTRERCTGLVRQLRRAASAYRRAPHPIPAAPVLRAPQAPTHQRGAERTAAAPPTPAALASRQTGGVNADLLLEER